MMPRNTDDFPLRKIIHVDMDAFYVSVEQRDFPHLQGLPVVVGGSGPRSVVAAAGYEARKFGVRSAMPSVTAKRLCPRLIFMPPRFEVYKATSSVVRTVFREFTDLIEPLALDEAFLDVTENKKNIDSAVEIAGLIRQKIYDRTELSSSAGISYNKFLAKLATEKNKPNGQYEVTRQDAPAFLADLPVEAFFGVGKVTAEKMHKMGIRTGADLLTKELGFLQRSFGKAGRFFYDMARGIDHRPVNPERERKSLGAETTFAGDLTVVDLPPVLDNLSKELARRLKKSGLKGRTITLKLKYNDFRIITRSRTPGYELNDVTQIKKAASDILASLSDDKGLFRLAGLSLSNFDQDGPGEQLLLF